MSSSAEIQIRAADDGRTVAEWRGLVAVANGTEVPMQLIVQAVEMLTDQESVEITRGRLRLSVVVFESGEVFRFRRQR